MKIYAVTDVSNKVLAWSDNEKDGNALLDRLRVRAVLDTFKVDIDEFYKRLSDQQSKLTLKKKIVVDFIEEYKNDDDKDDQIVEQLKKLKDELREDKPVKAMDKLREVVNK